MYNELNMIFDYDYIVNHSLDKDFSLEWFPSFGYRPCKNL